MSMYPMAGRPAGAAAGASFYNVSPSLVDLTDGSWLLYDPDSLVKSVTHSGGYNTVTWYAASASTNNVWHSGTTIRAPRWYKLLTIDGNQITSDNLINAFFLGKTDTTVRDFSHQFVFGVCTDPTNVTASTLDASGGIVYQTTTGNPGGGVFCENTRNAADNASNDTLSGNVFRGGRNMMGGQAANLNSSGLVNSTLHYAKRQDEALASTANQYLFVGVGTEGSVSVTEDDQQRFSVRLQALSLNVTI